MCFDAAMRFGHGCEHIAAVFIPQFSVNPVYVYGCRNGELRSLAL